MIAAQVEVEIARKQTLFTQSATFVEVLVLITLQKNISKESERKRKMIVWLGLPEKEEQYGYLEIIITLDLKIT